MEKKDMVMKANALIEAIYDINLVAERIIILAIIEAREQGEMEKVGGLLRITASDYQKHFNCDKTTSYRSLKSACASLYEAEFLWKDTDEEGKQRNNRSRFVQRAAYSDGGAYIEVMFSSDVIPLITRLSEKYTEYELEQIKSLDSGYALRVFELLMQWRSTGITPMIKIEDLRSRLGVGEHQYKTMGNFKARVLDFAIEEINDNTNIHVEYEQKKSGVKIIGFVFRFKPKNQPKKRCVSLDHNHVNRDIFSIDGLSNDQLKRIVCSRQFINDYSDRINANSPINQDMGAWAKHFSELLKKDVSQFAKRPIKEYLNC